MSTSDIFVGFGLTVLFAVGCQIVAARLRLPAIICYCRSDSSLGISSPL